MIKLNTFLIKHLGFYQELLRQCNDPRLELIKISGDEITLVLHENGGPQRLPQYPWWDDVWNDLDTQRIAGRVFPVQPGFYRISGAIGDPTAAYDRTMRSLGFK